MKSDRRKQVAEKPRIYFTSKILLNNKFHSYSTQTTNPAPTAQAIQSTQHVNPAPTSQPLLPDQAVVITDRDFDALVTALNPRFRNAVPRNPTSCRFVAHGKSFLKSKKGSLIGMALLARKILNFAWSAIGAAFTQETNLGLKMSTLLLGKCPDVQSWAEFEEMMKEMKAAMDAEDPKELEYSTLIEMTLDHRFRVRTLLVKAFSCPTTVRKAPVQLTYDRLEFLGDAIPGGLLLEYWDHRYPHESSNNLRTLATWSATNNCLGMICMGLQLYDFMLGASDDIRSDIRESVWNVHDAVVAGRNAGQFWEDCRITKCLGDLFGAVYVDPGFDWAFTKHVFTRAVALLLNVNVSLKTNRGFAQCSQSRFVKTRSSFTEQWPREL
ncbi:Dicer-like protein 1 [Mortierella sp. AD094]|nr:Dicer-like protein 1 [Mortierella sp. AD094]